MTEHCHGLGGCFRVALIQQAAVSGDYCQVREIIAGDEYRWFRFEFIIVNTPSVLSETTYENSVLCSR